MRYISKGAISFAIRSFSASVVAIMTTMYLIDDRPKTIQAEPLKEELRPVLE